MTSRYKLHRYLAKSIDFLVAGAFSIILPPVGPLAGLLYLAIADGFWHGQSLGKKLIGMHVIHEKDGTPIAFMESIIRNIPFLIVYIFFIVPFIGWLLLVIVGLPILLFESYLVCRDIKAVRVGDILAGTQVVEP